MKLKALIAAGLAVLTLAAGAGLLPASAQKPPGQDHSFQVTLSTTVTGANPNVLNNLTLCTDLSAVSGPTHECTAGTPAEPFFDQATAKYTGISVNNTVTKGSRVATITFDIESNAGVTAAAGPDKGQRAPCGTITHITPPTFEVFAAAKDAGAANSIVSMDPVGIAAPGFSFDQVDDPTEPDPTAHTGAAGTYTYTFPGQPVQTVAPAFGADVVSGDGWPTGINKVPVVIPKVQSLAGIPTAAILGRGYGVAVVAAGVSQTTVNFVTVVTGGGAFDPIVNITLLSDPLGVANPAGQGTTTCPPFSSQVDSHGLTLASDGSKNILGGVMTGPTDFTPAALAGQTQLTIQAGAPVYSYDILLSSGGDDDGDLVTNAEDDCPTNPDPVQASFAGIGTACSDGVGTSGSGYANNDAGAVALNAACIAGGVPDATLGANISWPGNPGKCTDIDNDGYLNAADNCPFVDNGVTTSNQKNNDGDGRGDACEGNGSDPTVAPFNNPAAIVKGDPGYKNGSLPNMVTGGLTDDHSDICKVGFATGSAVPVTPTTVCLAFGPGNAPPGPNFAWQDSNNDGVPDFLCTVAFGSCVSGTVTRDHKADSNGDGYSDADEGTPLNCGSATNCNAIVTKTTSETNSCRNGGRSCGSGANTSWDPLQVARNTTGGTGTGCLKTLDQTTALKTTNLAKADVDLDGSDSILDLSKIASWFGNAVGDATDPRWEGNLDGDGSVSILDISAAAANFGRSVSVGCQIQ